MSYRVRDRWKSKFARFVTTYGSARMAKHLEIHPTAIYQWIRGSTRPKPEHATTIQSLARERGIRLTLDEIYGHARDLRANDRAITVAIEQRKISSMTRRGAGSQA